MGRELSCCCRKQHSIVPARYFWLFYCFHFHILVVETREHNDNHPKWRLDFRMYPVLGSAGKHSTNDDNDDDWPCRLPVRLETVERRVNYG